MKAESEPMKRCTEWRGEHAAVVDHRTNYIDLLAHYEDTGLTPGEIQEAVDLLNFEGADVPKELKSWAERCTWHVRKFNELMTLLGKKVAENIALKSELWDNYPLTVHDLIKMDGQPVWIEFVPDCNDQQLKMWSLVSVDPEDEEIYLLNNLGGCSAYEEVAEDIQAIYKRPPKEEQHGD